VVIAAGQVRTERGGSLYHALLNAASEQRNLDLREVPCKSSVNDASAAFADLSLRQTI
jgi:hypothetical protein